MIWRISRRNSIIKWEGYRVSASRLAESNFRYTYAGFRFVCYCQDCQAFARFLDRLDGPYTSASRPNQFLFCSTLADNRRTIILVIEPVAKRPSQLQLLLFRLTGAQSRASLLLAPDILSGERKRHEH
jgi:hypothetical protein